LPKGRKAVGIELRLSGSTLAMLVETAFLGDFFHAATDSLPKCCKIDLALAATHRHYATEGCHSKAERYTQLAGLSAGFAPVLPESAAA